MAYPYAEQFLIARGNSLPAYAGVRWTNVLPANLAAEVPLIRCVRFGGGDDVITIDKPVLDIEAFAADRDSAFELAELIRSDFRLRLPGYHTAAGTVAAVRTLIGPGWRPYDNTNVVRVGASYEVAIHAAP